MPTLFEEVLPLPLEALAEELLLDGVLFTELPLLLEPRLEDPREFTELDGLELLLEAEVLVGAFPIVRLLELPRVMVEDELLPRSCRGCVST